MRIRIIDNVVYADGVKVATLHKEPGYSDTLDRFKYRIAPLETRYHV